MNKKTILIIDDQKDTQILLKKCLETVGYDIKQAWDGNEGLWKVLEHKPDLILVDVIMPEMNGIEFVNRLRDIDQEKSIPVIVISKRALIVNCFDENTIEGFFPKPIDMKALLERIAEVLKKEDILEFLKVMDQSRQEGDDKEVAIGRKNSVTEKFCKRCAYILSEDEDFAARCPSCGYPEFFTREVID